MTVFVDQTMLAQPVQGITDRVKPEEKTYGGAAKNQSCGHCDDHRFYYHGCFVPTMQIERWVCVLFFHAENCLQ
ncbi:MAG: hypothetical protein CVV45_19950 [Spirochaetae bacterium HGW-Spirochaetae-10]|nr:MAG: hypothetical protein CVV45_19950 [Spirochaetae bacterium HGW-Spirochaetae-10]